MCDQRFRPFLFCTGCLGCLGFLFFAGSELWSASFSQAGLRFLLVDPADGIAFVLAFLTFDGPSCVSGLVLVFRAGFSLLLFAALFAFALLFPEGFFFCVFSLSLFCLGLKLLQGLGSLIPRILVPIVA